MVMEKNKSPGYSRRFAMEHPVGEKQEFRLLPPLCNETSCWRKNKFLLLLCNGTLTWGKKEGPSKRRV